MFPHIPHMLQNQARIIPTTSLNNIYRNMWGLDQLFTFMGHDKDIMVTHDEIILEYFDFQPSLQMKP